MIINDLEQLEVVVETPNVLGGSGSFDYSTYLTQYLSSNQLSNAKSDAESQFGDANALAISYNTAGFVQTA